MTKVPKVLFALKAEQKYIIGTMKKGSKGTKAAAAKKFSILNS